MLETLATPPSECTAANATLDQFDHVFRAGLTAGRNQPGLAAMIGVFADTPLANALAESIPAIVRGEFQEKHFVRLAAARASLYGAQYDSLVGQVRSVLGRQTITSDTATAPSASAPLLDGVRHWLMELAITGFARLDANAIAPFLTTLSQLRQQPEYARLAYLLSGFSEELLNNVPVRSPEALPLARWCDLWSTAMLNAAGLAPVATPTTVSGALYPLGLEVRQRADLLSIVGHGLLIRGESVQYVRLTRSRYKVAAIRGDESWLLFPDLAALLNAMAQGQTLEIHDMALLPSGDLIWHSEQAKAGGKAKLLDIAARHLAPHAAQAAELPALTALDRHPVQLAEPIVLDGAATIAENRINIGSESLVLDPRWSAESELNADALAAAARVFGLLRFDGGTWTFQPLSAATKAGKLTFVGQNGAKLFAKPPKTNTVAILEERASRLLRK